MTTPSNPISTDTTPYHHGDLRAALVREARRLLEEGGVVGFSLRQVARAVGVSPSAPYRHFADREELLRAIAADGYRHLVRSLAEKEADAPKAARELARFAKKHPAWWELMARERSEQEGELEDARSAMLAELVGAVERSQGARDPEAAIRKAVAIWAVVVGTARLRDDGAFGLLEEWMIPSAGEVAEAILKARLFRPILVPRP